MARSVDMAVSRSVSGKNGAMIEIYTDIDRLEISEEDKVSKSLIRLRNQRAAAKRRGEAVPNIRAKRATSNGSKSGEVRELLAAKAREIAAVEAKYASLIAMAEEKATLVGEVDKMMKNEALVALLKERLGA